MLFLAELSKKRQSLIEYITICNGIKFWEETLSENHRNSKNPLTLWELPLALTTSFSNYVLPLEFQLSRGGVEMPFTSLTLPHCCACPQPGPGLPSSHVMVFLCSVSSVKMSGYCSFCLYWWRWFYHCVIFLFIIDSSFTTYI